MGCCMTGQRPLTGTPKLSIHGVVAATDYQVESIEYSASKPLNSRSLKKSSLKSITPEIIHEPLEGQTIVEKESVINRKDGSVVPNIAPAIDDESSTSRFGYNMDTDENVVPHQLSSLGDESENDLEEIGEFNHDNFGEVDPFAETNQDVTDHNSRDNIHIAPKHLSNLAKDGNTRDDNRLKVEEKFQETQQSKTSPNVSELDGRVGLIKKPCDKSKQSTVSDLSDPAKGGYTSVNNTMTPGKEIIQTKTWEVSNVVNEMYSPNEAQSNLTTEKDILQVEPTMSFPPVIDNRSLAEYVIPDLGLSVNEEKVQTNIKITPIENVIPHSPLKATPALMREENSHKWTDTRVRSETNEIVKQIEHLGEHLQNFPSDSDGDTSPRVSSSNANAKKERLKSFPEDKYQNNLVTPLTVQKWNSAELTNIEEEMTKELTKMVNAESKKHGAST
jgi:hypothetical protein